MDKAHLSQEEEQRIVERLHEVNKEFHEIIMLADEDFLKPDIRERFKVLSDEQFQLAVMLINSFLR